VHPLAPELPVAAQANVTAAYIANATVPSRWKTEGRGFPDVSAFSTDVCISDGCAEAGTSCAAPIVASAIATLNAVRAAAGKSALGFVNPLLYAHAADAFTDVTAGSGNGYPLATGWDPVTGLGVPQMGKLKEIVLALP